MMIVKSPDATSDLVLTRLIEAPRPLVFEAWINPARLATWWGPQGFTNLVCEVDARPGRLIRMDMRAPNGTAFRMTGAYREIQPPERLVFTSAMLDGDGEVLLEKLNTVLFVAEGNRTRLTLRTQLLRATPEAAPFLAGQKAGWTQSLERLDASLKAP